MDDSNPLQQWLAARNKTPDGQWLVGGSEIAAVLGWDPWCDRLKRWAIKRGYMPHEVSDAAEAGQYLEAGVLRWYHDRTGRRIVLPDAAVQAMTGTVPHDDPELEQLAETLRTHVDVYYGPDVDGRVTFHSKAAAWASLSVDAFVLHPTMGWGVVDAKCTGAEFRRDWQEAVPVYRLPQVAHYVRHTGLAWGGWAVCFGGQKLEWWDVEAAQFDEVNDIVADEVPRFIAEHLEGGNPPTAEPSPAMAKVLAALHPVSRPRQRIAWTGALDLGGKRWHPVDFDELWAAATIERKAIDDHWGVLQSVIRVVLGSATEVMLPNGTAYRVDRRNTVRRYERRR